MSERRNPAIFFRTVPLLDLEDDARDALLRDAQTASFGAGQDVYTVGDSVTRLYLVLSGRVRVGDGDDARVVEPGQAFGEREIFAGGARRQEARAIEGAEVVFLDSETFATALGRSSARARPIVERAARELGLAESEAFANLLSLASERAHVERQRHLAMAESVAAVAHELATPIGIASTAASLVLERWKEVGGSAAPEVTAELLAEIIESTRLVQSNLERAARQLEGLKDVSAKQARAHAEQVDLGDLLREVVALFGPRARRAHIDIDVAARLTPGQRCWIGPAGELSQVVLNLLQNVERYAYPDGKGGKVAIELSVDERWFALRVRDWGAGIPAAHLPRLFRDKFFTTGQGRGGTGLGLTIVRQLVEQIGGTVGVESEVGQGTTFTLRFPRTTPPGEGGEPASPDS